MELEKFLSIKVGPLQVYRIILIIFMMIFYFIYHKLQKYKPSKIRIVPHSMIGCSIIYLVIVLIL